MANNDDEALMRDVDEDMLDDEPIPARRDTSIFKRKKEDKKEKLLKDKKPLKEEEEEFDEDVFV